MKEYLLVIKKEFTVEEDSFFFQLRYLKWDKEAFSKLVEAMQICCVDMEKEEYLPRWLTRVFYKGGRWTRYMSEREAYSREYPDEYYEKACRRMEDLAQWFLEGQNPYIEGYGFEPL